MNTHFIAGPSGKRPDTFFQKDLTGIWLPGRRINDIGKDGISEMKKNLTIEKVIGREIIDSLLSSLIARLCSNAYNEIVTSYLLSVKGKNEVRGMLCSQDTPAKSRLQAMLELSRAMSDSPEYFHLYRVSEDDTDYTDSDCSEEIPPEREI